MEMYSYFKAGEINSEELRVLLVILATEQDLPFDSLTTIQSTEGDVEGYLIEIYFTEALSTPNQALVATLISDYVYVPPVIDLTYPEYANSTAAIAGGLSVGQIFRTGERLKQVLP